MGTHSTTWYEQSLIAVPSSNGTSLDILVGDEVLNDGTVGVKQHR